MKLDHRQELFDRVAVHLLNQGEQSYDEENGCRYRQDDLRCAVGCLIDDAHYDTELEGKVAAADPVSKAIGGSLGFTLNNDEMELLCELQDIHDAYSPETWLDELFTLARGSGLSINVLASYS